MRELGSKMADAASSHPPQLGRAASPGVEPALLGQPTVMDATQTSLRLVHERQSPSGHPESATVTMLEWILRSRIGEDSKLGKDTPVCTS